jgi:diguanylate cyclase (GGDEF)-like protein
MSILVVDPFPEDRNLIENALRVAGYAQVSALASSDEALERLGLVDVGGITGLDCELIVLGAASAEDCLDTCRRIKESFHYQDVPVIVCAATAQADSVPMAIAYGAHDYVRKPFVEYEFLARVRAAMRLKHEIDRRKARERELIEASRQLADLNAMLTRLSLIDSLTGVANRRNFDRVLDKEWRRAFRAKHEMSLIMIDIDHFKAYNDHYGHQGGDECLREVARILKEALRRPGDVLCRYGGEEFGVVLPDTGREGATVVAENLRTAVEQAAWPHRASKVKDHVTLSLGVASLCPQQGMSTKNLIELADKALYQSKAKGRNRVTCMEGAPQKKVG